MTRKSLPYNLAKYSLYTFLIMSGVYWYSRGVNSADFVYQNDLTFLEYIVAYSSVLDTAAWVALLIVLELETGILDDDMLEGPLRWFMAAFSLVCYVVIVAAFFAYYAKTDFATTFGLYSGPDPCGLVSQGATFVQSLDNYVKLTAENCAILMQGALYSEELNMFATAGTHDLLNRLAWLDVVNAGVWLVVVLILQLEVLFESPRLFGTRLYQSCKYFKRFLYGILFVCAYYWFRLGDPVAAWDAVLWLVAFFFIEQNLIDWQEEVAHERVEAAA